jgi:hypothetical protein
MIRRETRPGEIWLASALLTEVEEEVVVVMFVVRLGGRVDQIEVTRMLVMLVPSFVIKTKEQKTYCYSFVYLPGPAVKKLPAGQQSPIRERPLRPE